MNRPPAPLLRLDEGVARWRRRAVPVLVLTALGGVAGSGVALATPVEHRAVSRIALAPRLVHVPLDLDESSTRETTLDTAADLVRSDQVVDRVAATTGLSAADVRTGLTLSAHPASRVLVVVFTAATTEEASIGSHTAVEALLDLWDHLLAPPRAQLRLLRNQVSLAAAQVQQRSLRGDDTTSEQRTLAVLQDRLSRTTASARQASTVVRRTQIVTSPTHPAELLVASGAAVGLLLGLLLGRLTSRRPDRPTVHRRRSPRPLHPVLERQALR